jgi:hypothetical protein
MHICVALISVLIICTMKNKSVIIHIINLNTTLNILHYKV